MASTSNPGGEVNRPADTTEPQPAVRRPAARAATDTRAGETGTPAHETGTAASGPGTAASKTTAARERRRWPSAPSWCRSARAWWPATT
jgi:hypothetical protein